ncbi:MAG: SDR family NAD(P)-dependent oxidoreductase [Clostridia bacterium]|nr:SDR family NAD(P)-dependent oxidoreductase [Clostridia bacterium]
MKNFTLITGATGGIGKAFTIECAKKGYNLFLTGRSEEKLVALKEEIKNYGVEIQIFACDITNENSRKSMLEYIDKNSIKFERLINVAGVDTQMGFTQYSQEKVLFQIRVNVEGTISLTHAILSRKAENLEILTISSMSGASPMPYFALYSASKCMLTNFFTALHYELKKQSVKVTVVTPGGVPTREDIIKDIEGQGLWGKLSVVQPRKLARKSLKALAKNKVKYIPGFFNKLLNLIIKITPKCIRLRFIANRWKKIKKDAF